MRKHEDHEHERTGYTPPTVQNTGTDVRGRAQSPVTMTPILTPRSGEVSPRTSEVRPMLVRCPVCLKQIGNVLVDVSVTGPVSMPAHAYLPGYKCMGSGTDAVLLGRGDVIEQAAPPPTREAEVEVQGQWGQR